MKGVILCGGYGTRLQPLTLTTNKHILPIYNKQMVCYPLKTLKDIGITDICVVLGGENVDAFIRFLKDGTQFGLDFTYIYQRDAGGIAQAVSLCEKFVGEDNFVTILGDNLFIGPLAQFRLEFERSGALCGLVFYPVSDPCVYGVPRFEGDSLVEILEKPHNPPSGYAVTGIYAYTPAIFDVIRKLTPSTRGELEISDAHTYILREGYKVYYETFEGVWCDCGSSFDSLLNSSLVVRKAKRGRTSAMEVVR
ncbi:MAG: sugar nucleotidyltransferase [Euryarchaeota archaeon]|nr:sugar nucleotidyltransferase [Euryarchaeota archaeon]